MLHLGNSQKWCLKFNQLSRIKYHYLFNLKLMNLLIRELAKLLLIEQKKQTYIKMWNGIKGGIIGDKIKIFLSQLKQKQDVIKFITDNTDLCLQLKQVLNALEDSQDDYKTKVIQFRDHSCGALALDQIVLPISQNISVNLPAQFQSVHGRDVKIEVTYNPNRFNHQYNYGQFRIQNLLKQYIKHQLVTLECRVYSQVSKLKILGEKEFVSDPYTNFYIFDPFFNSLKIEVKKLEGTFKSNFKLINFDRIQIKFTPNNSPQVWTEETVLRAEDPVEKLVDYICTKEQADQRTKIEFLTELQFHQMKTIQSLRQVKIQDFCKKIKRYKLACQLTKQIENIRSPKLRSSFDKPTITLQKVRCLIEAYSHKILRYFYFKIHGIKALQEKIPYLNPQIIDRAIDIVERELIIYNLYPELRRYFRAFGMIVSKEVAPKFSTPTGMLFYGPPGTGKTKLTEELAELMGFHLVTNGLSSAEFMKQLVGQAKGMVSSYLSRPTFSPYLMCSIAIDQIDPLVMRRDGQSAKNSTQTISKFLSMLGGNEAVVNILVLASTNHKIRIDQAIIRRFVPNIFVGQPSKSQRKQILVSYSPSLRYHQEELQFLVDITPNFSGAALKGVIDDLATLYDEKWKRQQMPIRYTNDQLLTIAIRAGLNFNIKFGDETYPSLYSRLQKKVSLEFFKSVKQKTVLFLGQRGLNTVTMHYGLKETYFANNSIKQCHQLCSSSVMRAPSLTNISICDFLGNRFNLVQLRSLNPLQELQGILKKQKKSLILNNNEQKQKLVILLEIKQKAHFGYIQKIIGKINLFNNLYCCFYTSEQQLNNDLFEHFKGVLQIRKNPSFYTGKVLIDLSVESYPSKMEFQIQPNETNLLPVEKKPFIQLQPLTTAKQALPQIVQELIFLNLSYIQLINTDYFTNHGAFKQQQCLQAFKQISTEAAMYDKSALIIDVDSLVKVSRSFCKNNQGTNDSYSINLPLTYHNILNIIRQFPTIKNEKQRWVVVIVEDKQLSKMVRRDIKWPMNAMELETQWKAQQNQKAQESKQIKKKCIYCKQLFCQQQNQKQKTCMQHYGQFMDTGNCSIQINLQLEQAQYIEYQKNQDQQKQIKKFVYTCCWGYIGSQCCHQFSHYSQAPGQIDQLTELRSSTLNERWRKCQKLRKLHIDDIIDTENRLINSINLRQ